MKNVFIFIPDSLNLNCIGMLEGFLKIANDDLAFYITNDKLLDVCMKNIGYCSESTPEYSYIGIGNEAAWIHINIKSGSITVNGLKDDIDVEEKIICISYDYNTFKKSNFDSFMFFNYGEHFEILARNVQEKYCLELQNEIKWHNNIFRFMFILLLLIIMLMNLFVKIFNAVKILLWYSATAVHLATAAETFLWALSKIKRERKVTLTVGNVILARIMDFLCGFIILYFVMQYEMEFIKFVQNITESIIQGLEQLLNFLMGSPVGLKLNFSFNKTLGTFFLYHISLWRTFLQATTPLLRLGLHLLIIPGAFGLSFQAALISDLIAFSTFHVYCIYVYAARLYGVQIRGLTSLWRLFIGRKYNPLRKRVDSYQYTHHQLFIGTLGFTVLLFLLPTTFLYYAVFTVFRIILVALDGILKRLRYSLQCFPLYVAILWITNSPNIRGAIKLSIKVNCAIKISTVHATLQASTFWQSIVNSLPKTIENVPSISWSLLLHNILTGSLL